MNNWLRHAQPTGNPFAGASVSGTASADNGVSETDEGGGFWSGISNWLENSGFGSGAGRIGYPGTVNQDMTTPVVEETPVFFPATGLQQYDGYSTRDLSDDEWSRLTAEQQRAVTANALLFEASRSDDQLERDQAFSLLGLSPEEREADPTTFATWDDIQALSDGYGIGGQGYGAPLEVAQETTRGEEVLDTLRGLGDRLAGFETLQGISAGNLEVPELNFANIANGSFFEPYEQVSSEAPDINSLLAGGTLDDLLGRSMPIEMDVALNDLASNFFAPMATMDRQALVENEGDLALFTEEFGNAVKDLPIREVSSRFRTWLEGANVDLPAAQRFNVDELLEFYGLDGYDG